jgi:hypothetical protein
VYSVGVYLDKGSLLLQCKDLKSLNEKELLACKEFENTVVEGDTDKRIVLRMARNVAGDTMASAVEESVRPRMKGIHIDKIYLYNINIYDTCIYLCMNRVICTYVCKKVYNIHA